jgi:hypothetical protein
MDATHHERAGTNKHRYDRPAAVDQQVRPAPATAANSF